MQTPQSTPGATLPLSVFAQRVAIVLAMILLVAILWNLSGLFILLFGAVVVSTVLQAFARPLVEHARLPQPVAVVLVTLVLITALSLGIWAFGGQLSEQFDTLRYAVPRAWKELQEAINQTAFGGLFRGLTDQAGSMIDGLWSRVGRWALTASSSLTNFGLVLVGGAYLAAQPDLYRRGMAMLAPRQIRPLVEQALEESGRALRLWLGGQLVAMTVVGALTGLGLWVLDVPAALSLALITLLLDFVPLVGPFIAAVPAILLAFVVSPQTALLTAALLLLVQQLEGNVLQPLVQQRAVDLPPALLLFSLLACGAMFGLAGVLLSAPLAVVVYVLVRRLYVHGVLGEQVGPPGVAD